MQYINLLTIAANDYHLLMMMMMMMIVKVPCYNIIY